MIQHEGLIAAGFSPMDKRGNLNMEIIPAIVDHLVEDGLCGIYVCGSTGEGPSLSVDERKMVAQAYVKAARQRIPVIVQVGLNCLAEARELARHAQKIEANAISAVPPNYYKLESIDTLVDCLSEIASAAPDMPFYYYHIPILSGITIPMRQFIDAILKRVPNFAGIKYSAVALHEFQDCLEYTAGRCQIFYGCDEMLLSALSIGARAAIGSTYNFAAPLYDKIIKAFKRGDTQTACKLQGYSVALCRMMYQFRGMPAIKTMMKLIGLDCGPTRLPLKALTVEEVEQLSREVEKLGFFDWGRNPPTLTGNTRRVAAVSAPKMAPDPIRPDAVISHRKDR